MMGIDTHKLLQDAITLFVVINPFGAPPIFLAVWLSALGVWLNLPEL